MQVLRDAGDSGGSGGSKWDPRGRKGGGTKGLFVSSLTDSVHITYIIDIIMYNAGRNFHRPIQCVQDSEDDHGEKLSARHHFQL